MYIHLLEQLQVEQMRERSLSPSVPPVGESVEIVTGPPNQDQAAMRQDLGPCKRPAGSMNWEQLRAKNPRLTEG